MNRKKNSGFFIVEILLGIVVLSVVFLTLFSTISFLERRTVRSKYDSQAASLVEEATEIAHNTLLADWKKYANGTYAPTFDVDLNQWVLTEGAESGLAARFSRKVELLSACRRGGTGAGAGALIEESMGNCTQGQKDSYSRIIRTTLSWTEAGTEKELVAKLLVFNAKIQ